MPKPVFGKNFFAEPKPVSCLHVAYWRLLVILFLGVSLQNAFAEEASKAATPDKSQYNLFNPTPVSLMREMDTDRPDKTESPITVDAGHFQLEMDCLTYTHDRDTSNKGDVSKTSLSVAPANFKVGLLNNADLQVIVETWNSVKTEDYVSHTVIHQSGLGNITSRMKFNFWGNDGGSTAMGLMPFVKFPTAQDNLGNNAVEGGLIVPFTLELPHGFSLGAMSELDLNQNERNGGYHGEYVNSIVLDHDLVGKLSGYVEFFSVVNPDSDLGWIGTVDLGLKYSVSSNVSFDGGVNIGVTAPADDLNLFFGMSFRY